MGACKFNYKGHTFDNEMQLDDWLLRGGDKLYSKYGDLVFQQMSQIDAHQKAKEVHMQTTSMQSDWAKVKRRYPDGEAELIFGSPYIGVTSFLRGLTNADDQLLTPEFREFEYWKRRVVEWKDPSKGFNDDEKAIFGDITAPTTTLKEEDLQKYLDNYEEGQKEPDNDILKLIHQVKDKWINQGKAGTEIHNVLQFLFNTVQKPSSPYFGKPRIDLPDSALQASLTAHSKSYKYLTAQNIAETVAYAKNLRKELTRQFGENLMFLPEFRLSTKLANEVPGKGDTILGMIDLLVIDQDGNSHIIDYKASPKDSFNSAKERTFWYQLGLYGRMLQANGLVMNSKTPKTMVASIKMTNFRKEGDKYVIDKVEQRDADCLMDITAKVSLGEVARNLDNFVPEKIIVNVTPQEPVENTTKFMETLFKDVNMTKKYDTEDIKSIIEKNGGIQHNTESDTYSITLNNHFKPFTGKTESEVFKKVEEFFTKTLPSKRADIVKSVTIALRKGIKDESTEIELPTVHGVNTTEGGTSEWFKNFLGKYCKSNYDIIENSALAQYGIIAIKNLLNNQIDIIKVTTDNLDKRHKLAKGELLTGEYEDDATQMHKSSSLAMVATTGNIQLMETMSIINCIPDITKNGATIGQIQVVNPVNLQGTPASNEELIYNFNEVSKHVDGYKNNINGIKFATKVELLRNRLQSIISQNELTDWNEPRFKYYKRYKSLVSELNTAIDKDQKEVMLRKLDQIRKDLEKDRRIEVNSAINLEDYNEDDHVARQIYTETIIAMADLQGIQFRQQLQDNKQTLESINIFKNGVQSLMMDNPGNLNNDTLNNLTKLVTEAYQNVREDIQREAPTMNKLLGALKQSKGFNKMKEMTVGNQASLYTNMIKYENGDILFKKPSEMPTKEEADFLEYALESINSRRFSNLSEQEIEAMKTGGDPRYYRVPLAKGDSSSRAAQLGGWFKGFKKSLRRLNPKAMYEDGQRIVQGIFTDVNEQSDDSTLFEMTNDFETGERDVTSRLEKINKLGYDYFENNLETLVLKHLFAYSMQDNVDSIMPMAKASMLHLVAQGHLTNKKYENATNYIRDYIRNKIKGESLINPSWRNANAVAGKIKAAASYMVLGFSPVQYGYQLLQGLWTDIRVYLQDRVAGDHTFTLDNFKFAVKEVYGDMFTIGNKVTKSKALNEFFGMNDMDMNTYIDKIKSDKYGMYNASNIAMHCASRPDYFNRMSLFVARMKKDGSYDAYSVTQDGKLVYDMSKDERFNIYAKGRKDASIRGTEAYKRQYGLYLTMAEQLVKEHTKNDDGTLFKVGDKLPKAYTNQQIESIKSMSDDIYGYYSHEKKAMIHSTMLGSLWMQMKTYWSGKKNQYLGSPGVKLQGEYKQQKNDQGEDLWIKEDDDGHLIPTTENTGVPFMKWEGDWQEGIALTIAEATKEFPESGPLGVWRRLWNHENPEIRKLARKNVTQLGFDLIMFLFVGNILAALLTGALDDFKKDVKKNNSVQEAMLYSAANMSCKMVSSSFGDFNFIEGIGTPLLSWQPMSLTYLGSKLKNVWQTVTGDAKWYDTAAKMTSVGNQNRVLISTIMNQ